MLRLLCVTAHPDDEVGSFGGTLLLYGERGVETHVLCLTPGQAVRHRPAGSSDDELARIRRQEFAMACRLLGVSRSQVLDFPDAGLARTAMQPVVAAIVEYIRRTRPHVIMTMGPEGGLTGHADHAMASLFTTSAYHCAGRSDRYAEQLTKGVQPHRAQKLYYAAPGFILPDREPISPAPASAIIEIGPYVERKLEAFRAHKTQMPLFSRVAETMRNRGARELFHLAATTSPSFCQQETDLFHGVHE